MFDFLNKPYPFSSDLRLNLKLGSWIAIGVFLFILFFQPLGLDTSNTDSYILTVAGFAGISFLLIGLVRIILPWTLRGALGVERWNLMREILQLLLIWILNSIAFSFYLAYVGHVPLTMYLVFKMVLICFAFPVVILLVNQIHNQRTRLEEIQIELNELEEQSAKLRQAENRPLELLSDNRSDRLVLDAETLILIRSAENYVEILYRENQTIQKKLLRSTMVAMEDQLRSHPEMIRCHRTCIIHIVPGIKLKRTGQGLKLRIPGYDEEVPVSRQYLLGVRAALANLD